MFPLSIVYGVIVELRNFCFNSNLFKIIKFKIPVISIGNIITGGSGKTPFTMLCIKLFSSTDKNMVVISRGYGRRSSGVQIVSNGKGKILSAEHGGDEPVMIAKRFPQLPVIVSEKRKLGIEAAIRLFQSDIIILDDAFQHRWVSRNVDLVLINGGRLLNRERLLPLGNLREGIRNLRRASIVMMSDPCPDLKDQNINHIRKYHQGPIYSCNFGPQDIVNSELKRIGNVDALRDQKVYAFTGIAHPERFEKMLSDLDIFISRFDQFSDHKYYSKSLMQKIKQQAEKLKCNYILTTEKDMVKLDVEIFRNFNLVALRIKGSLENEEEFVKNISQFIDKKF